FVDESTKVVRLAVTTSRREEVHTVVAPIAAARKIGHWHELDSTNSQLDEIGKPGGGRGKGSLASERANVQFVDAQVLGRNAAPSLVGAVEPRWVDYFRRTVDPIGLGSGCGIGKRTATVNQIAIVVAGLSASDPRAELFVRLLRKNVRTQSGKGMVENNLH